MIRMIDFFKAPVLLSEKQTQLIKPPRPRAGSSGAAATLAPRLLRLGFHKYAAAVKVQKTAGLRLSGQTLSDEMVRKE